MGSSVCGVDDIASASDEALERLLDQIGRNDPIGAEKRPEAKLIEEQLAARKASGISISEDGGLHFPVQ